MSQIQLDEVQQGSMWGPAFPFKLCENGGGEPGLASGQKGEI